MAPKRRNPALAVFRAQGKEPAIFGLSDVERIAETSEFKSSLERREWERSNS